MQPRTTALFMSRPASAPVPPLRLLGKKCPRTRSALEEPVCEKLIESRQHRIPRQVERLRKVASRRQSNTARNCPVRISSRKCRYNCRCRGSLELRSTESGGTIADEAFDIP